MKTNQYVAELKNKSAAELAEDFLDDRVKSG